MVATSRATTTTSGAGFTTTLLEEPGLHFRQQELLYTSDFLPAKTSDVLALFLKKKLSGPFGCGFGAVGGLEYEFEEDGGVEEMKGEQEAREQEDDAFSPPLLPTPCFGEEDNPALDKETLKIRVHRPKSVGSNSGTERSEGFGEEPFPPPPDPSSSEEDESTAWGEKGGERSGRSRTSSGVLTIMGRSSTSLLTTTGGDLAEEEDIVVGSPQEWPIRFSVFLGEEDVLGGQTIVSLDWGLSRPTNLGTHDFFLSPFCRFERYQR